MFPTLKLSTIKDKWVNALANCSDIETFCQDNYGKSPTIFVGLNHKKAPPEEDYPLIILRPGAKKEGLSQDKNQYAISIGWGIINENIIENDEVKELEGIDECDEFGQLIVEKLVEINPSYPLTEIDYEIEAVEFFPKIIGEMMLELEIKAAIGHQIDY